MGQRTTMMSGGFRNVDQTLKAESGEGLLDVIEAGMMIEIDEPGDLGRMAVDSPGQFTFAHTLAEHRILSESQFVGSVRADVSKHEPALANCSNVRPSIPDHERKS